MRYAVSLAALLVTMAFATGGTQQQQSLDFVPGVLKSSDVPKVLLAPPPLKAEQGFAASIFVPPGRLFDPLSVIPRPDGTLWVNDDGDVAGMRGGDIWSVDAKGGVRHLIGPERLMPMTGFDVAPPGFGAWAGQIFTIATRTVARIGVRQAHIIDRVPVTGSAASTTVCSLPDAGKVGGGAGSAGVEARFGPPRSPFANKFFSIAIGNNTIYQTTPDGACRVFATFDSAPWGLAFTPDGTRMLVTLRKGAQGVGVGGAQATASQIVTVPPDGTVDPKPVFEHKDTTIFDVEVAPAGFGSYGGQLFFTQWGAPGATEREDAPPVWDGALYRVSPDGKPHLVVSGLSNPAGIAFAGKSMFVADVNRDGPFYKRSWVPDGFIVRIDLR